MPNKTDQIIVDLINIAKKANIIGDISEDIYHYYNDEPRFPSYIVELKYMEKFSTFGFQMDTIRRYTDFSKKNCLIKLLGESIERYCLSWYSDKNLILSNYSAIKEKALNPKIFNSFLKRRVQFPFKIYTKDKDNLHWVEAICLNNNKRLLVPAQCIYLPYIKDEPLINLPISTGAAFSPSLKGAILTGLLEIIERDAFMISYLNKLPRNNINLGNVEDNVLRKVICKLKRYNLEFHIIDISTDVPVYSILAMLIDKTGLGSAVSIGAKSALNINEAILGATKECCQVRPWIRGVLVNIDKVKMKQIQKEKYCIYKKEDRGLFWSQLNLLKRLNFFFKGKKVNLKSLPKYKVRNLKELIRWFKKEDYKMVYKDVTPAFIKKKGFFAVKVLLPEFQSLYLDERFPSLSERRLREIPRKLGYKPLKTVNKFPHPFL